MCKMFIREFIPMIGKSSFSNKLRATICSPEIRFRPVSWKASMKTTMGRMQSSVLHPDSNLKIFKITTISRLKDKKDGRKCSITGSESQSCLRFKTRSELSKIKKDCSTALGTN